MRNLITIIENYMIDAISIFSDDRWKKLPENVLETALLMYKDVYGNPNEIGHQMYLDGYSIETHTIGCRNAADTHEDNQWDQHWEIYDEYKNDGISIVGGDASDGIFLTITPQKK